MTLESLQEKIKRADDLLMAVQNQRNAALNECVNLSADLAEARRTIELLRSQVKGAPA